MDRAFGSRSTPSIVVAKAMTTPEPSTSGIAARDFQWALRRVVGDSVFEVALGQVSLEAREVLCNVPTDPWVPLAMMGELIEAARDHSGMDEDELMERTIRMSTEHTINTVWRVLLRVTTDKALITRTPLLWKRTRNVGQLEVTEHGKGRGTLQVTGWPGLTRRSAFALAINIRTILECAGRKEVRVKWGRSRDGARYHVSWAT